MAEIARAGILSVDKGQAEAAQALGMPPGKTMRRVVLPQAMRVIVPPTGNETIAMVKDTSLLVGGARHRRAVLPELPVRPAQLPDHARHRRGDALVPHRLLDPDGRAVRLERYYGRGFGAMPKKTQQKLTEIGADH